MESTRFRNARTFPSYVHRGMVLTRRALVYAAVGLVTLVLAALVLQIWRADLNIPFYYGAGGDVFEAATSFKLIAENGWGWVQQSTKLGMPFGAEFYGYPSTSLAHEVAIKLLLTFVRNPIAALNIYFLMGFPLSAITALYALRRFGITTLTAAGVAILFSFLPYKFFRNEAHVIYGSYFFVPLSVMVVLWVARGDALFRFSTEALRRPTQLFTRKGWIALVVCLLLAFDNPYNTFFFTVLIVSAALIALVRNFLWGTVAATSAILLATIAVGFALTLSPTWQHNRTHPGEGVAFRRSAADSETYSLTLTQLLLPIEHHRLAPLAAVRTAYDAQAPNVNENGSVSLGLFGAIGLLLLTSRLLLRPFARPSPAQLLDDLASLNAIAFLLGTFGGFGTLFAFYVSTVFHALNRIAPFIAFFSFFAIAVILDQLFTRLRDRLFKRAYIAATITGVVAFGLLDQTSGASVPPYATDASSFDAMQRFTNAIEASLPVGSSVFELPIIPFPEEYFIWPRILPLEELAPFVHSKALRWSYGSFPDSASNLFQIDASTSTPRTLALKLALGGFAGLLIDRNGYADAGASFQRALSPLAVIPPIASEDGKWLFINLTRYTSTLAQRVGHDRFLRLQQLVANPIEVEWRSGCSLRGAQPDRVFRWCGHDAELALTNPTPYARSVRLSMVIVTRSSTPSAVTVDVPSSRTTFMASVDGAPYASRAILLPSGTSIVRIHTDAPELPTPGVTTPLVFELANLSIQDSNELDFILQEQGKPRNSS